ncbi:hypothetical protein FOZ60_001966 [Perkinsus olseni]|uniref:RRM domain-containing protein n=1 Tax=Perkinsus olseni TaxID=32597 RepID=A0A7J6NZ82_PEROL|nr:hypothetical protein FOZ60_001966 [Perkinsus olseni]
MEGSYKAVVAGADASPDASTVSGCATGATSAATSWSSSAHSFVDNHHDEPAYSDPVPKMPRPAYKNPIVRKLKVFVGGLPQGLQENDLKDYFNDFGDAVIEVEIKMDKVTGRSRGFGFVTLMNGDSTRLFNNKHRIKNKDIDVDEVTETKIFVGGLNPATGEQAVIDYFSKYGAIVNCELAFDHAGMSRGFAFVIFEDAEAVHRTLEACPTGHSIEDRMVDVRRAEPRKKLPNGQSLSQNMFGVPDLRQGGPIRNGSPQNSPAALTGTFLAVNGLSPTSTSSSTTCGSPTAGILHVRGTRWGTRAEL